MKPVWLCSLVVALLSAGGCLSAAEGGYLTATFGNDAACTHPDTLKAEKGVIRFDLSGLPAGVRVRRAILHVPLRRGQRGGVVTRVVPVGLDGAKALTVVPPDYRALDATAAVAAWVAKPASNQGLRIASAGAGDFRRAVLAVSGSGPVAKAGPAVKGLKAVHRSGQTFLTWAEPEDVVGADAPTFEAFEKSVLEARSKRRIVYRIYRSDKPITAANLGAAEMVREVPEATSCWNLLAIANTEHPQRGRTKRSPLRGGNLVLAHVMTRWKLTDAAAPIPRATGLAVFTAAKAGARYYAVTVAVHGAEAVASVKAGVNVTDAVAEKPGTFPAIVHQRTRTAAPKHRGASPVDVYVCWLQPPYVRRPRPVEVYLPRWKDLPAGADDKRLPLYLNLGTYGCSATELSSPIWHGARRHVGGAVTIGLSEEGTLWTGDHECIGTLRGLNEGVVWNYAQRRVLATTAWATAKKNFFIDPDRVYLWGQFGGWALRYGNVYAVVMSNGHNNFKTSREARKHAWRWGGSQGKNWLGVKHMDYLDLAAWVRDNPKVELPYWVCWPAYGAFPDHSLGDFGFKPWQDFVTAMQASKRAFTAVWMSNGPGQARYFRDAMVPKIRLSQSLPAFTNCSLDTKILTDNPKGSYRPGKYDQDFQKHADKSGGINLHQRWDTDSIVDEPNRWAMTVWLAGPDRRGRGGAPADEATMDLTPRRCRKFKPAKGAAFQWTNTVVGQAKPLQTGSAVADDNGLLTVSKLKITKAKHRIEISPAIRK